MKRILVVASALFLLVPAASFAAPGGGKPGHHRPGKPGDHTKPSPGNPGNGHKPGNGHRPGNGHKPGNRPGHGNRPGWNKPGRPGHGWYYGGKYRNRFRVNIFVYPRGYGYRTWAVGQRLPSVFLSPTYYYTDYSGLGLNAPPPGYQWVRYGNDILLVNIATGGVVETLPGVFYN